MRSFLTWIFRLSWWKINIQLWFNVKFRYLVAFRILNIWAFFCFHTIQTTKVLSLTISCIFIDCFLICLHVKFYIWVTKTINVCCFFLGLICFSYLPVFLSFWNVTWDFFIFIFILLPVSFLLCLLIRLDTKLSSNAKLLRPKWAIKDRVPQSFEADGFQDRICRRTYFPLMLEDRKKH